MDSRVMTIIRNTEWAYNMFETIIPDGTDEPQIITGLPVCIYAIKKIGF